MMQCILYQYLSIPKFDKHWFHCKPTSLYMIHVPFVPSFIKNGFARDQGSLFIDIFSKNVAVLIGLYKNYGAVLCVVFDFFSQQYQVRIWACTGITQYKILRWAVFKRKCYIFFQERHFCMMYTKIVHGKSLYFFLFQIMHSIDFQGCSSCSFQDVMPK